MSNPIVTIEMENGGIIRAELYPEVAPNTVRNFVSLAGKGFYDGTIFHRVIPGFMIQGGGFNTKFEEKPTRAPIKNEAGNGLRNGVGMVSMARTADLVIGRRSGDRERHVVEDGARLPADRAQLSLLLEAFTLDKALYELLYELNNRPDWVRIPLQGITQLLNAK